MIEIEDDVPVIDGTNAVQERQAVEPKYDFEIDGNKYAERELQSNVILKWSKSSRFERNNLLHVDDFAAARIKHSHGPLNMKSFEGGPPEYENSEIFIGTTYLCSCFELYCILHDCRKTVQHWDDERFRNHRVYPICTYQEHMRRKAGDPNMYTISYVGESYVAANSIVALYQYDRIDGRFEVMQRVMGLVTNSESRKIANSDDSTQTLEVMYICSGPSYNDDFAVRFKDFVNDDRNREKQAQFDVIGYVGTVMKQLECLAFFNSFPDTHKQIFLNRAAERNFHNEIEPRTADGAILTSHTLEQFIDDYVVDTNMNLHLKYASGVKEIFPSPEKPFLNVEQTAAVVSCLKYVEFCIDRSGEAESALDNNITMEKNGVMCIVGPPGTGKTTTIIELLSLFFQHQKLWKDMEKLNHANDLLHNERNTRDEDYPTRNDPALLRRVLILTETNAALDVLEKKLNTDLTATTTEPNQSGSTTKDLVTIHSFSPFYKRVSMKHETTKERKVRLQQNNRAPIQEQYKQFHSEITDEYYPLIVLSTFGGLWKCFTDDMCMKSREEQGLPQYDLILIDEASEASVRSFLTLIAFVISTTPHIQSDGYECSSCIIVFGDPWQTGTMMVGSKSSFSEMAGISLLDTLIPNCSPEFKQPQISNVPFFMLRTQYRFNNLICDVSNAISSRTLRCAPDLQVSVMDGGDRYRAFRYNNPLYVKHSCNSLTIENFDNSFSSAVVWIDPYAAHYIPTLVQHLTRNETDHINRIVNQSRLVSKKEAFTIANLVCFLVCHEIYPAKSITVITPYNDQHKLLSKLIRRLNPYRRQNGSRAVRNNLEYFDDVSIFTSKKVQGKENDCVIYSPVRDNKGLPPAKHFHIGLSEHAKTLYVSITRPKRQLFIVGDYNFLTAYRAWKPMASLFH